MSIKVRATTRGYYGGQIREAGDEFEVEDRKHVGSWMDPAVEEKAAPKAETKDGKKGSKAKGGDAPAEEATDLA